MQVTVTYDNEDNGEYIDLEGQDISLCGADPHTVVGGNIATYKFPDSITEEQVLEALEESAWSYSGLSIDEGAEPSM